MDVEAAYAFLGVPLDERGSLEKLKMRFRKLCLAYHPDKNLGREKEAAAAFTGLHAAYHFLTTTNQGKRLAQGKCALLWRPAGL